MFEYAAKLIKIIDADTIRLDIDLGMRVHIIETVRLIGIDAPELGTIPGQIARSFVVKELTAVIAIKIQTTKPEKYGRWLATLLYQDPAQGPDWRNLNDLLLSTHHAVPYNP